MGRQARTPWAHCLTTTACTDSTDSTDYTDCTDCTETSGRTMPARDSPLLLSCFRAFVLSCANIRRPVLRTIPAWLICLVLLVVAACHRPQFVALPEAQLAEAQQHFALRFGRPLSIDAQVANGTLGAGVLDSSMRTLPDDSLIPMLDTMATWLYAELGRPRAVTGIVLSAQVGDYRPCGIIWSAPGHEPGWMMKR